MPVVVQCGEGKVNAGICAQTLVVAFGVARIINTGVAGSHTNELAINDFVVSVDAVQHDYDLSPLGFRKGEIPNAGTVAFPADEQKAKACACSTLEEMLALAKEEGYELSDEALEAVSGGLSWTDVERCTSFCPTKVV